MLDYKTVKKKKKKVFEMLHSTRGRNDGPLELVHKHKLKETKGSHIGTTTSTCASKIVMMSAAAAFHLEILAREALLLSVPHSCRCRELGSFSRNSTYSAL